MSFDKRIESVEMSPSEIESTTIVEKAVIKIMVDQYNAMKDKGFDHNKSATIVVNAVVRSAFGVTQSVYQPVDDVSARANALARNDAANYLISIINFFETQGVIGGLN